MDNRVEFDCQEKFSVRPSANFDRYVKRPLFNLVEKVIPWKPL